MGLEKEELERFVPYYLPADRQRALVKALREYPHFTGPFYASTEDPEPLQGDGWQSLRIVDVESGDRDAVRGLVLTNSCDLAKGNKRMLPTRVTFSPLIRLGAYAEHLRNAGVEPHRIDAHLKDVRDQAVTSIFYLPPNERLTDEHICLLDEAYTLPIGMFPQDHRSDRIFTLSNTGFYLFLFKLTVHFCRMHEEIDRDAATA